MFKNGSLSRLYNPPVFQGRQKRSNYFEGWYFKLVDAGGDHIWSVIPGISYSEDTHSFIQVIHAQTGRTYYQRFPIESFKYEKNEFRIEIGSNFFSDKHLALDIKVNDLKITGELTFEGVQPFPVRLFSPGIMGWYSFVPFMECYHGVVSMQHTLHGSLKVNGSTIGFDGGRGYIEKDWGRSMPTDWIWMQSNHFDHDPKVSFMLSVARIPWLNGHFPGFLSFLQLQGKVYRFATYNRSKVVSLKLTREVVQIVLRNREFELEVEALRQDGGMLKAPRHGAMEREIQESIISSLKLVLKNRRGDVLHSDTGKYAGLEIVGDMVQYY